ncbi:hypothetical protein ACFQ3S_15725 [Mucilaginibacter terrae]|uniref:hypothetical protein n=1 Tax=Mucilaginibacter terrae TaxID=1955052 RepID=UPI003643115E
MSLKRRIYLVANKKSEQLCENLIYSIRQSGCKLPIKVIHFGGDQLQSIYILENATLALASDFPADGQKLIDELRSVLSDCPLGFLYRFLAWYGEWDEFIYSDNDVVALCNWELMFEHLKEYEFVHADEEYKTKGKYNFIQPDGVEHAFGPEALNRAITAGHFAIKRNNKQVKDFFSAVEWFLKNPGIPKKHDQALMHVAIILGNWKTLNLCTPPQNWLSSWAGDYKNPLQIIHEVQKGRTISHLHYSDGQVTGTKSIEDLIYSFDDTETRLRKIVYNGLNKISGLSYIRIKKNKILKRLKSK